MFKKFFKWIKPVLKTIRPYIKRVNNFCDYIIAESTKSITIATIGMIITRFVYMHI